MTVSKILFVFMVVLASVGLKSSVCLAAKPKFLCKLRSAKACGTPRYFLRALKDGCAKPQSNCRQKFCRTVCLGESQPLKESQEYKVCQQYCDPQEIPTFSRQERLLFNARFEDKNLKRKNDLNAYIASLLSRLPWCEGECDYDESAPTSCESKHAKNDDHWSVCAKNCYFIKDIKDHADQCIEQSRMIPTPNYRRPAPPPPIKRQA